MFNISSFIIYMLVTAFTPGPNNITSMTNAARYGFKKSWPYNLGLYLAFSVVMILCALASTVLNAYVPKIKPYMIGAGAAYMLHLAWQTFRAPSFTETDETDKTNENLERKKCTGKTADTGNVNPKNSQNANLSRKLFFSGAALQFMNPKIIIYGITSLSVYIVPCFKSRAVITLFALLLAFVGTTSTVCWALAGSKLRATFTRHSKIVNPILALLLLWCTVSLFL